MAKLVPFTELPDYPDLYLSPRLKASIDRQGLIEPLVRMPDGSILEEDRCLFQAFKECAMSHGEKSTTTCLIVEWDDLTDDDKAGLL